MSLNMTKKLDLVANEILGVRMTESEVIDRYELEISEEDLVDEMLDRNIELCSACLAWKEAYEIDPDQQESICFECSNEEEEE